MILPPLYAYVWLPELCSALRLPHGVWGGVSMQVSRMKAKNKAKMLAKEAELADLITAHAAQLAAIRVLSA